MMLSDNCPVWMCVTSHNFRPDSPDNYRYEVKYKRNGKLGLAAKIKSLIIKPDDSKLAIFRKKKAGLTQEVADLCDVSIVTVLRVERSLQGNSSTLEKLRKYYGNLINECREWRDQ